MLHRIDDDSNRIVRARCAFQINLIDSLMCFDGKTHFLFQPEGNCKIPKPMLRAHDRRLLPWSCLHTNLCSSKASPCWGGGGGLEPNTLKISIPKRSPPPFIHPSLQSCPFLQNPPLLHHRHQNPLIIPTRLPSDPTDQIFLIAVLVRSPDLPRMSSIPMYSRDSCRQPLVLRPRTGHTLFQCNSIPHGFIRSRPHHPD